MHAEIMAYLTDYGSLSGEKGNGVITALPENSFEDLASLAAAELSPQIGERATGTPIATSVYDPTAIFAEPGP